jgi:inorganic pyrophosphatase
VGAKCASVLQSVVAEAPGGSKQEAEGRRGTPAERVRRVLPKSLFKIWNFGVANAKILPCRLQKSPKIHNLNKL